MRLLFRHVKLIALPILCVIGALKFFTLPASSQTIPIELPTPPPLPEPSDGINTGTIVNSANAPEFRGLIIPEFYPLIRARLISMDAVSSIKADLSLFKIPSAAETSTEVNISKIKSGLPFPEWRSEKDEKKRMQMLAWNIQSRFWTYGLFSSDFSISFIQDAKLAKQYKGTWQRIYPSVVTQEDKSVQLFRELIQFTNPGILKTLKYLTFRFAGQDEDMLWFSSPSLKKVRELTGSNRGDSILDSSFSPDDMLAWSGKSELSEFNFDKELTALVPFSAYGMKSMTMSAEGCHNYVNVQPAPPASRWNYATHRFPDAFAWLPTDAVFVPRKVIRIELIPKDPFTLYGRQILYVDEELMIPYFKFVFNRAGYLWKTIFNFPVLLQSKDKNEHFIFTDYLLVEDRQNKNANIVEFDNVYFCKTPNEKNKISIYDPQKLIPQATATPKPNAKK